MSESEQRKHHPYSPSTLQSLEACPSYIGKQSDTPHERTTAGTRAHGMVESGTDDNRLDDEDAVAAAECMDFVSRRRQLMDEARARDIETFKYVIPEVTELKEAYLPIDDEDTTAGYCDWALIDHTGTNAEMGDHKFGMWPVEDAKNNLQGIAYALGLFKRYPTLKTIHFWFHQPHLELITDTIFTRSQIPELYLRVKTVVARAREARRTADFSTAKAYVPNCSFCANLGKCPVVAEFACRVGHKFHPLEIPADITPTMVLSSRDTTLAMRLSQTVAVWAQAFRTQTTDRVLRGDANIPAGFKLEQRSKREVVDGPKFKEIALHHLTEAEYAGICDVPGFGATEEIIKEKAPRGSKKAAIEDFQKELEEGGAVRKGDPYCFLRAVAEKSE